MPLTNEDLIHKESTLAKCNISQSYSADNLFAVISASHGCMHRNLTFFKAKLTPTMPLGFLTRYLQPLLCSTGEGVNTRGIVKLYVYRLTGIKACHGNT